MSKQLYPKPRQSKPKARKHVHLLENEWNRPYHVHYTDPSGELDDEWKHYNTEAAVKTDAWYQCVVLGFRTAATLFTRDEVKDIAKTSKKEIA